MRLLKILAFFCLIFALAVGVSGEFAINFTAPTDGSGQVVYRNYTTMRVNYTVPGNNSMMFNIDGRDYNSSYVVADANGYQMTYVMSPGQHEYYGKVINSSGSTNRTESRTIIYDASKNAQPARSLWELAVPLGLFAFILLLFTFPLILEREGLFYKSIKLMCLLIGLYLGLSLINILKIIGEYNSGLADIATSLSAVYVAASYLIYAIMCFITISYFISVMAWWNDTIKARKKAKDRGRYESYEDQGE